MLSIHEILRIYLSYNWKFVSFDQHLPFSPTAKVLIASLMLPLRKSSILNFEVIPWPADLD